MGLRFRKSINLGGARINLSKKGIGASIGVKGARITRTASGKTRKTISAVGTGLSYSTESGGKKKRNTAKAGAPAASAQNTNHNYKVFAPIMKVLGIILIVLSLLLWLVILPIGIIFTVFGVCVLLMSRRYKRLAKEQEQEEE